MPSCKCFTGKVCHPVDNGVFAHSNGIGSSLTQPQLDTPQSKIIFSFSYYHLLHARIISD